MVFVDEMPTRQLEVPDEPGEWFEVRLLSWKELEECRREQSRKFMARAREMGVDLLKTVADLESDADARQKAAIAEAREQNRRDAELEEFDREMLVTKSVVGWSYQRHFQPSALAKLDERTFDWLFESIVALYLPGEEQARAEGEVAAGSSSAT